LFKKSGLYQNAAAKLLFGRQVIKDNFGLYAFFTAGRPPRAQSREFTGIVSVAFFTTGFIHMLQANCKQPERTGAPHL
jgi:hypothetical protein